MLLIRRKPEELRLTQTLSSKTIEDRQLIRFCGMKSCSTCHHLGK